MKTKSGYETNGDYIKFKSGFTGLIVVETQTGISTFKDESEANNHIITKIIGCEEGYVNCEYWRVQQRGCVNCMFGSNENVLNSK